MSNGENFVEIFIFRIWWIYGLSEVFRVLEYRESHKGFELKLEDKTTKYIPKRKMISYSIKITYSQRIV